MSRFLKICSGCYGGERMFARARNPVRGRFCLFLGFQIVRGLPFSIAI